jgi:hypothetical protein
MLQNEHLCSVAVQFVSEPEICHSAGFKLRADARFAQRSAAKLGVRVHKPLQNCLECRNKGKNCDEQLTHMFRVRRSGYLDLILSLNCPREHMRF